MLFRQQKTGLSWLNSIRKVFNREKKLHCVYLILFFILPMKTKLDAGCWAAKAGAAVSGVVCVALTLHSSLRQPRRARAFLINVCHSAAACGSPQSSLPPVPPFLCPKPAHLLCSHRGKQAVPGNSRAGPAAGVMRISAALAVFKDSTERKQHIFTMSVQQEESVKRHGCREPILAPRWSCCGCLTAVSRWLGCPRLVTSTVQVGLA